MSNEKTFSTIPQVTGDYVTTQPLNTPPTATANFVTLVQAYLVQFWKEIKGAEVIVTPGQPHAAMVFNALGELIWGLPRRALLYIGTGPGTGETVGVNLHRWRHETCRGYRDQRTPGERSGKTFIFVGGHAFPTGLIPDFASRAKCSPDGVIIIKFGDGKLTPEEVAGDGKSKIPQSIVDAGNAAGMTVGDWESANVYFDFSGLGALGNLQELALYALCGVHPEMIRRVAPSADLSDGAIAEIISLQELRQQGKTLETADQPIPVPRELLEKILLRLNFLGKGNGDLADEIAELLGEKAEN